MAANPTPPSILERYQWLIMLLLAALIAASLAYLVWGQNRATEITLLPPLPTATPTTAPTQTPLPSPAPLEIYITGAVAQPQSRLSLAPGSRVEDAIAAAGGALPEADLSRVNLAQVLRDGDQIHLPSLTENTPPATPSPNAPRLVSLNTATQAELESLPEVGPSTAAAIIAYREAGDGFQTLEELMEVEGIGPATFEAVKPFITLED